MALAKKPVTGMRDITPAEMQIREYVMNQIKETYKGFGFTQIETPCVEHIGNLTSKQGGDNEKLIFKILKRGDKLNLEGSKEENDLVDSARLAAVIREAMEERKKGVQVLVAQMNKNKKFQKEQLGREGYTEFKEFYKESLKN